MTHVPGARLRSKAPALRCAALRIDRQDRYQRWAVGAAAVQASDDRLDASAAA
ncbi:hypothetical protein [Sorangium sp. So ce426]|uniref:hypothetical protein n=1 Tax=Sorangium sp. So ce426 TaxID=3133312 RepID=UPI003F5CBB7E